MTFIREYTIIVFNFIAFTYSNPSFNCWAMASILWCYFNWISQKFLSCNTSTCLLYILFWNSLVISYKKMIITSSHRDNKDIGVAWCFGNILKATKVLNDCSTVVNLLMMFLLRTNQKSRNRKEELHNVATFKFFSFGNSVTRWMK